MSHTPETATAPPPAPDRRVPRELRRLFRTVPWVASAVPVAFAVSNYYFAIQVQDMEGDTGKVASLALLHALSAAAAMLAQPIAGVLSDRTRSRFGSRRPWMLVGATIGTVALLTAGLAPNFAVLLVLAMLIQFGYNAFAVPFGALLPDRVPEHLRGRYSTGAGLGALLGAVIGPAFGAVFKDILPLGYALTAGLVMSGILLFVALVPDRDNSGEAREPFSLRAFLTAFWVNPIRHPDFFWGFTGRLLLFGSYFMINGYSLYIAQDYIGLAEEEAKSLAGLLGLVSLPGIVIATAISGPLSDRLGRRKPVVLVSGLLIVVGAVIPLAVPSVTGLMVSTVLVASGFGAFVAVDQALMSSLLPSAKDYGKDLGVLNLAATLPGTVAPLAAGAIVLTFGGYGPLYLAVGVIGVLGALAVLPIKSVR